MPPQPFKIKMQGLRLNLIFIFFILLPTGCKHGPKYLIETPIEDVVNHKLLKTVGYKIPELPPREYDERLAGYIEEFRAAASAHGVIFNPVAIDSLRQVKYVERLSLGEAPGVLASCNRYYYSQATVSGAQHQLYYTTIEVLSSAERDYIKGSLLRMRKLMFHEAFHCFAGKGHLPDDVNGIMSAHFHADDNGPYISWAEDVRNLFSQKYMDLCPNID